MSRSRSWWRPAAYLFGILASLMLLLHVARGDAAPLEKQPAVSAVGTLQRSANSELVKELWSDARKVSTLYRRYGPGLPLSAGFEALWRAEEGNCAQESYLFARLARKKGFPVRVVGVWGEDGANHVVVEVQIGGAWHTFDATNGIHYRASVGELVTDPALVRERDGEPEEISKFYASEQFWEEVVRLDFWHSLDYAERNLLAETGVEILQERGFMDAPYDFGTMLKGVSYASTGGGAPAEVQLRFPRAIRPYRLHVASVRSDIDPPDLRLEAMDTSGWEVVPLYGGVSILGGRDRDFLVDLGFDAQEFRIVFNNPVYIRSIGFFE